MNTYYEILGLEPTASQIEIKKAYFKLIRKYSPESDPEQFQKIREAYEELKNAQNAPQGPSFPEITDPFEVKMLRQIEQYHKAGDNEMFRDCCEEARRLFPKNMQFLYLLIIAQRRCGNTGKAVKNAELLLSKDPDNKWFQRELAIAYMERGYTQKAFPACEKAYELGCRDMDFLLMYAMECNEYANYDIGVRILSDAIQKEKKWSKEEMPELINAYGAMLAMDARASEDYFPEIIEGLLYVLEQYSIYMSEYATSIAGILAIHSQRKESIESEEYQKEERIFDNLLKACRTDSDKEIVEMSRQEMRYHRMQADHRIGDTLIRAYDAFCLMADLDPTLIKFAVMDVQLCMIEERQEILEQAEIIRQDFPDLYEKLKGFLKELESGKNLSHIKDKMLKIYQRLEPDISGGVYYKKYPEEKRRAQGTVLYDGMSDEPYMRTSKKVGRNDPCPCGSGKKYKHCCMRKG